MDEGGAGQGEETNRDQINGEEERKGRMRRRGRETAAKEKEKVRPVRTRSGAGESNFSHSPIYRAEHGIRPGVAFHLFSKPSLNPLAAQLG